MNPAENAGKYAVQVSTANISSVTQPDRNTDRDVFAEVIVV